jgi:hypothetical protein
VSFMIFTVSVRNILDTTSCFVIFCYVLQHKSLEALAIPYAVLSKSPDDDLCWSEHLGD